MLPRRLAAVLPVLRRGYPAVVITGPRQSGKTTLARQACPDLPFVNFESPLERAEFAADPNGFLDRYPAGAILDEVQHVPDLFSYLQVRIDRDAVMGRWLLTGSQQLELGRGVSQSLAGRAALLELLPLSFAEVVGHAAEPRTLADAVLRGGYPPLFDPSRDVQPARWLEDYIATFINRDVRAIIAVKHRIEFDRFVRLCAARTGQLLNASELSRDCGVDGKTIAEWLSVLEACYLIRLLRPHHRNFGKRITKSPKLFFIDSGLACRLLHIADVNQLVAHPSYGPLVETWCVGEAIKTRLNAGVPPAAWFWRSGDGIEVDLLLEIGEQLYPFEVKSSASIQSADASGLDRFRELGERDRAAQVMPGVIVYGGAEERTTPRARWLPWRAIAQAVPVQP